MMRMPTLFEIYAEIDRLVDDLKQVVISGLEPIGRPREATAATADDGGDVVTGGAETIDPATTTATVPAP